jgi:hypothetical protein
MLVPAIAFGWWMVSMSAHPPHPRASIQPTLDALAAGPSADPPGTDTGPESEADDPVEEPTDDPYGEKPAGERVAVKLVTPEIVRVARSFLDLPMGAERSVSLGGQTYVFVLERHYHPPGFVGAPNGWHKGVTVYEYR